MGKTVVSLDDLLNETAGYVSVAGINHPVSVLNASEYQAVVGYDWNSGDIGPILDIVSRVAPSLDAGKMTLKALGEIIGIAVNPIEKVESDLPNSSGPATSQMSPAAESPAS